RTRRPRWSRPARPRRPSWARRRPTRPPRRPPRPPNPRTRPDMATEAAALQSEQLLTAPKEHGHITNTGLSNEKLAMWAFLGSECLLFGALISTYFLYRGRSTVGPLPKNVYDIPYTSVSSFVLLMSSLTMVLALASMQRHDQRRMRVWLLTPAMLGSV